MNDASATSPNGKDPFAKLLNVMRKLRAPVGGCPWDLEQSFDTIAPYTIEEAYEVADAIERRNMDDLKEELGDLLFQVVFHSQLASEAGHFNASDVAEAIANKMIRRHPHVFEDSDERTSEGQTIAWEEMKAEERALKSGPKEDLSALNGVARALPALMRAEKLQKRAARTGFDWTEADQIFSKLDEEVGEVKDAIKSKDQASIEDEIGDLLFVVANLARRLSVDPEIALRGANAKFERRFRAMEKLSARQGKAFDTLSLNDQEKLWQQVKGDEH